MPRTTKPSHPLKFLRAEVRARIRRERATFKAKQAAELAAMEAAWEAKLERIDAATVEGCDIDVLANDLLGVITLEVSTPMPTVPPPAPAPKPAPAPTGDSGFVDPKPADDRYVKLPSAFVSKSGSLLLQPVRPGDPPPPVPRFEGQPQPVREPQDPSRARRIVGSIPAQNGFPEVRYVD